MNVPASVEIRICRVGTPKQAAERGLPCAPVLFVSLVLSEAA